MEAKETELSKHSHKTNNPIQFAEYLKAKAITDMERQRISICKGGGVTGNSGSSAIGKAVRKE